MSERNYKLFINDIIESIDKILKYVDNMDYRYIKLIN
jgi:uncharacterized protein with HEPN domain